MPVTHILVYVVVGCECGNGFEQSCEMEDSRSAGMIKANFMERVASIEVKLVGDDDGVVCENSPATDESSIMVQHKAGVVVEGTIQADVAGVRSVEALILHGKEYVFMP